MKKQPEKAQSFLNKHLKLTRTQTLFFSSKYTPPIKLQRLAIQSHRKNPQHKNHKYLGNFHGFSCFADTPKAGSCLYEMIDPFDDNVIATAETEDFWLTHIVVDKKYQRCGLGTSLIKFINKNTDKKLLIPAQAQGHMHRYYLSQEGARLINSCIRKKILLEEQCFHEVPLNTPTSSPGREY